MNIRDEELRQKVDAAEQAIKLIHEKFGKYDNYAYDYGHENGLFARLKRFLGKENVEDYIWMWERPNRPHTFVQIENLQYLPALCKLTPNSQELVWFVVDIWLLSAWLVYEGILGEIEKITEVAPIINYYVIAKDFRWLVAKSRRNEFIAIGEDVEKNLRRFLIETEEM